MRDLVQVPITRARTRTTRRVTAVCTLREGEVIQDEIANQLLIGLRETQ